MRDFLAPTAVQLGLVADSKRAALQQLASLAAPLVGVHEQQIFSVLLEREKLGTTGVGAGIAIPHGKLAGLSSVFGLFARFDAPVPFEAIDDKPVDLMMLLLAPEDAGADHLKALALVSRQMRDVRLCDKLRKITDAQSAYALLTMPPAVSAA